MGDKEELQELRTEKALRECLEKEREVSNVSYARKIVEVIVFSMVAIILTTFLYQIINLIVKHYE